MATNGLMKHNIKWKPIIFYPFGRGVNCFFEKGGQTFKSFNIYTFKEFKPILQGQ
jgi:hypothetical protein